MATFLWFCFCPQALSYKLEGLAKDKDCSFLSSAPPLCTCLCVQSISAKLIAACFPRGQPRPTLLPPLNVISKPRKQRWCLLILGRWDVATGRNPGPIFIHTFANNFIALLMSVQRLRVPPVWEFSFQFHEQNIQSLGQEGQQGQGRRCPAEPIAEPLFLVCSITQA